MNMAAPSRTAPVSLSKLRRRLPRKSARTGRPSAYPLASPCGGSTKARKARPRYLAAELDKLGLAYVHILHAGDEQLVGDIRARWKQALIVNRPGRPRDQISADVASGLADLEAYGQMVLANPDFVARLKTGAPMNEANRASFFGGAAQGYTDYPALAAAAAA
jgi:2,4-dienoyl-CoA reductase-like NADH-dependent reductase (Old Yellow Enzyme family)